MRHRKSVGKRKHVPSNPWVDGNDLLEQLDDWHDDDGRHIAEWRWRDTEQTVHLLIATNEIVGFGTSKE